MAEADSIPSPARLAELLTYDPDTGLFIANVPAGHRPAGRQMGTKNRNGYFVLWIDKRLYYAHRVAWAMVFGQWPDREIDHINGNPSDNRIANLRLAIRNQNVRNMRKPRTNTSGFKGVNLDKRSGTYYARIWVNNRPMSLGWFSDPITAARAYNEAAVKHHGEFARINHIP